MTNIVEHLSEQPWSNYTKADYTLQQWHNACLIHLHDGPPTSKSQCKLPIKTPNGVVNRNGVHAAAAALAGARGGVNAPSDQKSKAARSIRSMYTMMKEKAPPSMSMSEEVVKILEHHGTKGMKWGVRRAEKKAAKADKKWQKNIYSFKGAIDIHNNVADKMNGGGLDRLNARYPNLSMNLNDSMHKRYYNEYEQMNESFTRQAIAEVHGTSPSGKLKATLDTSVPDQWKVTVVPVEAKHADAPVPKIVMEVEYDDNGYITLVKNVKEEPLAQSAVQEILEHHGVRGMKWGVRKGGSQVKTSSDFKKTASLRNRKTRELSNKQLQQINARINMEQQYSRLNPSKVKIGLGIATGIVGLVGTADAFLRIANGPTGKALIALGQKVAQKKL